MEYSGRSQKAGSFPALILFVLLLPACRTASPGATPLPAEIPPSVIPQKPQGNGGVVEEIRFYTELGSPSSLLKALEIILGRDLGSTEFGRTMTYVNVSLLKILYPAVQARLPQPDPPVTHNYSRILRNAEKGTYTVPSYSSSDYLEHVLPFLAYYPEGNFELAGSLRENPEAGGKKIPPELYLATLQDLEKAAKLNSESVLAPYFLGIVFEQANRTEAAFNQYALVYELFPECFPAALGIARLMETQGRKREVIRFLQDLALRFPDNLQVKRQLAIAYYHSGDWPRAEAAAAEILQKNERDGEFVLMRAHILVAQGHFFQAQALLDIYAGINPTNKLYLFLRAKVQAEAYQNRDSALNYLRSILRNSQQVENEEAAVYATQLLMESSWPLDQIEGRDLLNRLLSVPAPSLDVISLALRETIRREAWTDAKSYLARLLEERRSSQDLLAAYTVEREQGNKASALSYARELYEKDRSDEEGIIAYISALIETGRMDEAARIVENRLNSMAGGVLKSRYYYLRSLTRSSEETAINDLNSSLFENPRNLDALTALFEIYHQRKDEKRAVYYLKQALTLAPENLRLKYYEEEYASALGGRF
jgi:tetratricopeptide (TPR) repeat protein